MLLMTMNRIALLLLPQDPSRFNKHHPQTYFVVQVEVALANERKDPSDQQQSSTLMAILRVFEFETCSLPKRQQSKS
jgi:hypothetical protein